MEFARPHRSQVGVAYESNINLIEKSEDGLVSDPLDNMLIDAANDAATKLFGTQHLQKNPLDHAKLKAYTDSRSYPERIVERSKLITEGSLVVIFECFDSVTFVYAAAGAIFHNRNGMFYHDDFIGKPFGCKIRSRNNKGLGYVYLLRPTAELWARSLPHRTQIVHELDASMIVFYLNLRPGMLVCESGTGSGAMSHAILRTIAPSGTLHTFEFNEIRADKAREEFKRNLVDRMVTVHHRDVCGKQLVPIEDTTTNDGEELQRKSNSTEGGGFGIGGQVADAIFLDLPEPWLAVPHAAYTIKPNGQLCSYSPCVEQTQRCVAALRENGFHSIRTIEARLREYYVDDVELESPPRLQRPGEANNNTKDDFAGYGQSESEDAHVQSKKRSLQFDSEDTGAEEDNERSEAETDVAETKVLIINEADGKVPAKRKKLCARPFSSMRGHTAFLTFATAGLKIRPNPSEL